MDNTAQSPVAISLCPGILGLERGLERAIGKSITIAAYSEIEAFVCANLVAGMEAGILAPAPIWTDVKTFPFAAFHRKVHIIMGGYPCQPFSLAGNRKGTDDPRHLWPYIECGIDAVRPICCFFENVAGHLSSGFPEVYQSLRRMGYQVECGIYTAEEIGAPHERKRIFILALANSYVARFRGKYTGGFPTQTFGTGEELAHPDCPGFPQFGNNGKQDEPGDHRIGHTGSELANTQCAERGQVNSTSINNEREINVPQWKENSNSFTQCNSELANAGETESEIFRGGLRSNPESGSNELANTNSNGHGTESRGFTKESSEAEGKTQWEERNEIFRERLRNVPGNINTELANGTGQGLEIRGQQSASNEFQTAERNGGIITDRWPAGQGQPVHSWEEPRAVESGLGCTVDGYNFREDLLRALGNSVVEQTAELAFKTLMYKLLK